ncbi:MAG: hypothetical protein GOVbin2700_35 [Prokaryotic dsDNA virus sp.]|nr:MAG: hypothetical protein GOVbin2700_35 [Prokaryotic dsDNA virus sp.]|tara:strand:+ start:101 stop:340 length:240 start_codon:yes stop_codon:yes gene_type:complete
MKFSKVYFDENNQKVRWTQTTTDNMDITYDYVGKMTRVEFDLLIEILWEIFEDKDISLKDFMKHYKEIRSFCDRLKTMI